MQNSQQITTNQKRTKNHERHGSKLTIGSKGPSRHSSGRKSKAKKQVYGSR